MVTSQMLCLEDGQRARDIACNMTSGYQNSLVFHYLDTFPKPPGIPDWPELIPEPTPQGLEHRSRSGLVVIGTPEECTRRCRGTWMSVPTSSPSGCSRPPCRWRSAIEAVETFGAQVLPQFDTDPIHSTTRQREAQVAAAPTRGPDEEEPELPPLRI